MRPITNKESLMAAASLLLAVSCSFNQTETQAQTGSTSSNSAPKTAPDRRARLQRPSAAPPPTDPAGSGLQSSQTLPVSMPGSSSSQPVDTGWKAAHPGSQPVDPSATTTVSLQGGVTRLDGTAEAQGNQQRQPLSGKIESLIETPLTAQKPRSEQIAPLMFKAWLDAAHPQFSLSASQNPDNSIVVLKGQWDDSSKTLKKFEIPHVRISGGKLASFPLNETKVVIVDCAGDLPSAARQKLRDFVMRGGYLLSTDWALNNFTGPTFINQSGREYIEWNKGVNRRDIVDATACDTDPVLFAHAVTNAHWKLDQDSHLIRILNRDAVRVLATSSQLVQDDPDRAGVLAVVFPYGRGYVMHMTGHFDNNAKIAIGNFLPDPAPIIKIGLRQALAANFVVAGLTQTRIATNHRR